MIEGREPSDARQLVLASSWQRCRAEHRLLPTSARPIMRLQSPELRPRLDQFRAALLGDFGEIEHLAEPVVRSEQCLVVTDSACVALMRSAPSRLGSDLDGSGIATGSLWTEKLAGTNGVSMALAEGRPYTVAGRDHFFECLADFTCTAAPLLDHENRVIGVLDISSNTRRAPQADHISRYLLTVVTARIQARLFRTYHRDALQISLARAEHASDEAVHALCAIDAHGRITGATDLAAQWLGYAGAEWLVGERAEAVLGASIDGLEAAAGRTVAIEPTRAGRCYATPRLPGRLSLRLVARSVTRSRAADALALKRLGGNDPAAREAVETASVLYRHGVPLVLVGETGVGKTALARTLHQEGDSPRAPFLTLDGSLFSRAGGDLAPLVEALGQVQASHLAADDRFGTGTVVIESVDELSRAAQALVSATLKEIEPNRLGELAAPPQGLRLVATTTCGLGGLGREGAMRQDLVHQLAGGVIRLPPMRERSDFDEIVAGLMEDLGACNATLSADAAAALRVHPWLGNWRELRHALGYARLRTGGRREITLFDLPEDLIGARRHFPIPQPLPSLAGGRATAAGSSELREALASTAWNVSRAARRLGVSRATLHRRMKEQGIARPLD